VLTTDVVRLKSVNAEKNDEGAETPTPVGLGLLGLVIDLMYNKMYSQGLEKIMIRTHPVQ